VSAKRGLLIRHAQVDTNGLRIASPKQQAIITERGARVSSRR
jgi:hypothetical protein